MRNRRQAGQIIVINNRWYLRFYQRVNTNGVLERKRVTYCLGAITTRGKHPPADIVKAAEEHMQIVNHSAIPAERTITLTDFMENVFLPHVRENLRTSTSRGYAQAWRIHVKPVSSRDRVLLKDVKTFTVQRWLNQIGREDLARNTMKRVQSTLSGCFKLAKRLGFYDGINPVQDTAVNPHAAEPAETYAYSLEEIQAILAVLPEPAATAFGVACFTGLRRGEIEALEWSDYYDGELHVERSIWNGQVNEPKTAKSRAPVPVIRQLAERLEFHRLRSADPETGPPETGPMFINAAGHRLSLNNLLNRQILPALNVCRNCGVSEGKDHLQQDHEFQRDDRIPKWHGFHAARRGLGSNLYRLGVPDKVIQAILRHSNVAVTLGYYIKSTSSDVVEAMEKFQENFAQKTAGQNLRDSNGTVKPDSGAMPEFVN